MSQFRQLAAIMFTNETMYVPQISDVIKKGETFIRKTI